MHERYEENWASEKDADEYKKITADEQRQIFFFKMLKASASRMFKLKRRQMSALQSTQAMI